MRAHAVRRLCDWAPQRLPFLAGFLFAEPIRIVSCCFSARAGLARQVEVLGIRGCHIKMHQYLTSSLPSVQLKNSIKTPQEQQTCPARWSGRKVHASLWLRLYPCGYCGRELSNLIEGDWKKTPRKRQISKRERRTTHSGKIRHTNQHQTWVVDERRRRRKNWEAKELTQQSNFLRQGVRA